MIQIFYTGKCKIGLIFKKHSIYDAAFSQLLGKFNVDLEDFSDEIVFSSLTAQKLFLKDILEFFEKTEADEKKNFLEKMLLILLKCLLNNSIYLNFPEKDLFKTL